jgi:uncharacterized protein involved in exopolysaccharide biosynthesis
MDERQLTIKDIWDTIWPYRKMIIRNVLIVVIIAVIVSLILPKWYKSTAVILPPTSESKPLLAMKFMQEFGLTGMFGGDEGTNRVLSILKSNRLLEAVAIKYNFMEKYDTDNMEETLKELGDNLEVSVEDEMQIAISFWDKDQEQVADITNYIIHCLDSLNIRLSTGKARANREFIEARVKEVIDSLRVLESQITEFMEEQNILSLEDQLEVGVKNAAEFKAQIMAKEVELAIAKNTYEQSSSIVKQLENEITSYKAKYREFFQDNPGDKLMPNFSKVPEIGIEFTRLKRQVEYYVKVLEFLAPEYESSKIEEVKTIPTIQILDQAVRPEKKDKPKRVFIVIGAFVLATIVSLYMVYWQERVKVKFVSNNPTK